MIRDKKLIEHLHEYEITSTYKISAAVESDEKYKELQSSDGFIQEVSDNFDALIYSQNELRETYRFVTIITQPQSKPSLSRNPISRLKQEKLKSVKITEVKMKYFQGQKNPLMPESFCKHQLLPVKVLCHQKLFRKANAATYHS